MTNEEEIDHLEEAQPDALALDYEPGPRGKTRASVRYNGVLIHQHLFPAADAAHRARFARDVAKRAKAAGGDIEPKVVEDSLLAYLEQPSSGEAPPVDTEAKYSVVRWDEDPEREGIYLETPDGPVRLTNFVLQIAVEVERLDGGVGSKKFSGPLEMGGKACPFEIDASDYPNSTVSLNSQLILESWHDFT